MSRIQEIQQNMFVGNFNEALKICSAVITDEPGNADAFHLAGLIYTNLGHLDESIKLFKRAIKLRESASFYYNLGVAYAQMEQSEEALACYSKALELNPKDANAWNNKGVVLQEMKEYDQALSCWQQALQLNPGMKVLLNNIGTIYLEKGDLGKALEYFKKALNSDANDPLVLKNWDVCRFDELEELGIILGLKERQNVMGAESHLLGPSLMGLMRFLGNRYNRMGHGRLAAEWYVRALKYKEHKFQASENRTNSNAWFANICPTFSGKILSAGSGEDYDKQGKLYRQYFKNAGIYLTLDCDAKNQPDMVGDLQDMREHVADQSCDVVFCAWALEHVKDLNVAVSEIHRVLKPAGKFIFGLPCNMAYHSFPHDYHRFMSDGIRQLFGRCFEILELYPTGEETAFALDQRLTLIGNLHTSAPPGYMGLCRRTN